ncbi:MAG: DUF1552 domain-containing protein [Deltaproteobacteria bacterium]|nr:DUF1552 domain-containing protein [Deltaproteobacteria bacterium]
MKNVHHSPGLASATRRQILRTVGLSGLGLGAGTLSFRPIAQAAEIPKRLVVFYTIGGVDPAWDPKGDRTNWELSDHLSPLKPFKEKLNLVSGLKSGSAEFGFNDGGGHGSRSQHALAAWAPKSVKENPSENSLPGGVSFDNFIAEKLRASGNSAPIDHLYLLSKTTGYDYHDFNLYPSRRSNGEVRHPDENAAAIVDLYFPKGNSKPKSTGPDSSAYLVNFLKQQYDRYAKADKMDLESKRRFSSHLDRLTDLEKLSARAASDACTRPEVPTATDLVTRNRFFAELVATALACDTARVILLDMGWAVSPSLVGGVKEFNLPPANQTIHELGHEVHGTGPLSTNQAARDKLLHSFRIQNVDPLSQLLAKMDSVQEADGKTLLDHSAVLWCQQSSDGNHGLTDFRYLLAGGAGGKLKTNQYLHLPGRSTADVWVTLAKAMGISDTTGIADRFAYDGPIDELL